MPATKSEAYPKELADAESKLVDARRERAQLKDTTAPRVGLALSGGGIRSATFCLGVLQSLARLGLIRRIDYLSTVSGGSYCGGFLGAMICRPADAGARSGVDRAEHELADRHSPVTDWLRQHGRYLSPNGSGDEWTALAAILRNWVAVQTVLLSFVAAVVSAMVLVRVVLERRWGIGASEGIIWWSPFWVLPLVFLALSIPFGLAFWMVPRVNPETGRVISARPLLRSIILVIGLGVAGAAYWFLSGDAPRRVELTIFFGIVSALILLAMVVLWYFWEAGRAKEEKRPDRWARSMLTQWVATFLKLAAATALLALIDSLGETLYVWLHLGGGFGVLGRLVGLVGIGGSATLVRWLLKVAREANGKGHVSLPIGILAGAAAVLVGGAALVGMAAFVHAVAWESLFWPTDDSLLSVLVFLVAATVLSIVLGATIRFANDSSQQALYGGRLARAYLGASNPQRQTKEGRRVTDPIQGDDIALNQYTPAACGGPLHFINVTLNETVEGESQIEHRDRKGLAMAVGPAGLTAGVRHHALWGEVVESGKTIVSVDRILPIALTAGFRVFVAVKHPPKAPDSGQTTDTALEELQQVEPLSLATWVSVSGAAVAPGLGARTSLGFSLLLTVFNVRLGYWWNSLIHPKQRRAKQAGGDEPRWLEWFGEIIAWLFPVQTYLFYELLGRFYGPNRQHWYLTDGGHFENTGAYELIRRRVPFSIVCDCGEDADFDFADVANLVRKARTDFNAEITFLRAEKVEGLPATVHPYFGVPADFSPLFVQDANGRTVRGSTNKPRPCAMLARVDYDGRAGTNAPEGVIMFLKPTLGGAEAEDILHYAQEHVTFPHESTADQFFDEAQWESYRLLGESIADRLFTAQPSSATEWTPASLTPLRVKP